MVPKNKVKQAKKKGLSLNEKCSVIEHYLAKHEKVYMYKTLENLAPTLGIPSQSLKEVISLLEKEKRIKIEKVGSSNIYWYFKSDLLKRHKMENETLNYELNKAKNFYNQYTKNNFNIHFAADKNIISNYITKLKVLQVKITKKLRAIESILVSAESINNFFEYDESTLKNKILFYESKAIELKQLISSLNSK